MVKVDGATQKLTTLKRFQEVSMQGLDPTTKALSDLESVKMVLTSRSAALKSTKADEKLQAPMEGVSDILDKYPMMSDSSVSLNFVQSVKNELDLTTTLPAHYGCLRRLIQALEKQSSPDVLADAQKTLKRAAVSMACVSAVQMLERKNNAEALNFGNQLQNSVKLTLKDLPAAVCKAVRDMVASADGAGAVES